MKIVFDKDRPYLTYKEERVALEDDDLEMFKLMTPLGRKIHLRQKAKQTLQLNPTDPEATLILRLFNLPARNWTFMVP